MSHQLPRSSSPHRYSCARFVQAASCAAARERRRRRLSIPASLLVASAGRRRRRRHDRAPGTVDHAQGGAATGGGPAPAGPAPGTQVGDDLAEAGGGADPGTHDSRRRPVSDGVGTCTVSRTNCAIALCNRIVQPHCSIVLCNSTVRSHRAIALCNRGGPTCTRRRGSRSAGTGWWCGSLQIRRSPSSTRTTGSGSQPRRCCGCNPGGSARCY